MLIREAMWFGRKLSILRDSDIFPMLNVGSSTDYVRRKKQPWIYKYIFKPINNKKVVHMDAKQGEGVDITADLSDKEVQKKLRKMRFRSVFCSNLLEHVRSKEEISKTLSSIVCRGGYIFVSCPYKYPYHLDPIDTKFRPDIKELAGLFPNAHVLDGKIVTCGTYFDYIKREPLTLIKTLIAVFLPFYSLNIWFSALDHLFWMLKPFKATCLIMVKDK